MKEGNNALLLLFDSHNNALLLFNSQQPQEILDFDNRGEGRKKGQK